MTNFGWDLPPGCRESDIPGNSAADMRYEKVAEAFIDECPERGKCKQPLHNQMLLNEDQDTWGCAHCDHQYGLEEHFEWIEERWEGE